MSKPTAYPSIPHKRTPVCSFCKSLNDPLEASPFGHWLRESPDPASPITCPILRWTECTYCSEYGHTKKYCKYFIRNESLRKLREKARVEMESCTKEQSPSYILLQSEIAQYEKEENERRVKEEKEFGCRFRDHSTKKTIKKTDDPVQKNLIVKCNTDFPELSPHSSNPSTDNSQITIDTPTVVTSRICVGNAEETSAKFWGGFLKKK
jgi:hypothetical protein